MQRFRKPHLFPPTYFEYKHAYSSRISQREYRKSAIFEFKNLMCVLSLACYIEQMLHEDTISRIREQLIEGKIAPGSRIPEQALCSSLGISRTPLREALKVLAAEGHVVLRPNRGAWAAKLTMKDVVDLFDVAAALEAAAGELACKRIGDDGVAEISALHSRMKSHFAAVEMAPYYACNRAIHEAIVKASDNPVLISLYDAVNTRIRRARYVAPMHWDHWQHAMSEHEAMLNALQRRDGAVLALVLKIHLRNKVQAVERAGFAEPGQQVSDVVV